MISRLLFFLLFGSLVQAAVAQAVDSTYILRPNDGISLVVYDEPDLTTQVRILKSGHAAFPLIGSVEIGGLSMAAATTKIRDLYAKDYLVDPKPTLTVLEYSTDHILLLGAVRIPGQVALPQSGVYDLASALASAGGLAPNADPDSITLIRASGSSSTYSASSIQGTAGRTVVNANDRIVVGESTFVGKKILLLGQVQKPGPVLFPVNGKLDLVTAVALAGGVTPAANPRRVSINRRGKVIILDFEEISKRGDKPYYLEPDDVISVAQRLF